MPVDDPGIVNVLLWILSAALVVAGIIGTIVPSIPGPPIVFAGLFVAAWIDGFEEVGWITVILLAVMTMMTFILDYVVTGAAVKKSGASGWAVGGTLIGSVIGIFFGIPGMIIGPFVGAVCGEYIHQRNLRAAGVAGAGAWLGLVLSTAAKLTLVFAMLGIFLLAYML